MVKYLHWLKVVLLLFSCIALHGQNTTGNTYDMGSGNNTDNTIVGDDLIINNYNYPGLTEEQLELLRTLKKLMHLSLDKVTEVSRKISDKEILMDSLFVLSLRLRSYEEQIKKLEMTNDSIVKSLDVDSAIYYQFEKILTTKMNTHLAEFWESNPYYDPSTNVSLISSYEKATGQKLHNIYRRGPNYDKKYMSCNACVRDNPQDWVGIYYGGVKYYFEGQGLHTIYGFEGKNFSSFVVSIPEYGSYPIDELREHYKAYWNLKNNKETTLKKQYAQYLSDPLKGVDNIANPKTPCERPTSDVLVKNRTGEKLRIWMCRGNTGCSSNTKEYEIEIAPGQTGTFYNIPKGIYSYDSRKGSGIVYRGINGQIRIQECVNATIIAN